MKWTNSIIGTKVSKGVGLNRTYSVAFMNALVLKKKDCVVLISGLGRLIPNKYMVDLSDFAVMLSFSSSFTLGLYASFSLVIKPSSIHKPLSKRVIEFGPKQSHTLAILLKSMAL